MNVTQSILLQLTLILISSGVLDAQNFGLGFNGQEVPLDKRTELDITYQKTFIANEELEVSFDLMNKSSLQRNFGYVMRIIDQNDFNIDLLSLFENGKHGLYLVNSRNDSVIDIPINEKHVGEWMNLRLKLLINEQRIVFYAPDSFYVQQNIPLQKNNNYRVLFGACSADGFRSTDVPSMNIKDVKISLNGSSIAHWPLNEENGTEIRDQIGGRLAKVRNPLWLEQMHKVWKNEFEDVINGDVIVASDEMTNKIFIITEDRLIVFAADEKEFKYVPYSSKPDITIKGCRAVYHKEMKCLVVYHIDEKHLFKLDVNSGLWENSSSKRRTGTSYLHHNKYLDYSSNSLFLFGGYGQHQYLNGIQVLRLDDNTWSTIEVKKKEFSPRYLAGSGYLQDSIYIFGGYGSHSGNQMINPRSNYTLLAFNLVDHSFTHKFEVPHLIQDMCIAQSMYIDSTNRNYYTLGFDKAKSDSYLQLLKGNLDTPELSMVGSRVPYSFVDIKSYADLYYFNKQEKLFAITTFLNKEQETELAIYSINYPPSVVSNNPVNEGAQVVVNSKWWLWLLMFLMGAIIVSAIIIRNRLKRKQKKVNIEQTANTKEAIIAMDAAVIEQQNEELFENYDVIFFGGFQVYNSEREDITSKFTPLMKELFLLLWLYTFKNNKGIPSDSITEIIWPDKTEKSAKNNRAVNFAKLRNLLEEIGRAQLSNKTGYWKITHDETLTKSDYVDFLNLTESKVNLNKSKIKKLINIVNKGAFLRNVDYEWLDDFKSNVSDRIVDTFVAFSKGKAISDPEFKVEMANCIFKFDIINEEALVLKCRAQCLMGQHGLAKKTYQHFTKEYTHLYGEEYSRSFADIAG